MSYFWQAYLQHPATVGRLPLASPVLATPEQLRALPPSLVVTAELDPLRVQGEAFAERARAAGAQCASHR
jgi:acetyl esterase